MVSWVYGDELKIKNSCYIWNIVFSNTYTVIPTLFDSHFLSFKFVQLQHYPLQVYTVWK